MDKFPENIHLTHLDLVLAGIGRIHRFGQFHRFIILDEEKEDGHDRPGNGHQPEGMPPTPMCGYETAEAHADGDTEGN